jgi:transposase
VEIEWGKATLSLDLRTRILTTYDAGQSPREEVARRYRVSLGMVKKLLQQRRTTGDIGARLHRCGRKPRIGTAEQRKMRTLLGQKPDRTLAELRTAAGLDCTLPAIHYVLVKMGLSYKKRHSAPVNKTVPTSPGRAASGGGGKAASTRRGSSSSTKAAPKRT